MGIRLLTILLGISLFAPAAHAVPDNGSIFDVGLGFESALTQGGINVLLHVNYENRQELVSPDADTCIGDFCFGPTRLVWAQINGDWSDSIDAGNGYNPYTDIRFVPVQNQISVRDIKGNGRFRSFELAPMGLNRNIRINEDTVLNVSVIGYQYGEFTRLKGEPILLFAQVAADLLGYKTVTYLDKQREFKGLRVGALGGEAGIAFPFFDAFFVRIVVGAGGDLNVNGAYEIQSDMNAYLAIKTDVNKLVQLFARIGFNGNCDSGLGACMAAPQLLTGASIQF